jgi:hypothetical protein
MMAYNNYNPYGMPNYYPTYQPQMPQAQTQPTSSRIWVSGEAGAKAYLLAPNTSVDLWDSEAQTIYLKSADALGMPSMKIIDYTIRDASSAPKKEAPEINLDDYVTKKDFDAFEEKIKKQIKKISIRTDDDE